MDAELAVSPRTTTLFVVPCADCRTKRPALVKFNVTAAGTGGSSRLAVQTTVFSGIPAKKTPTA